MDNKAQWSLVAAAWVLAVGVLSIGIYAVRHFSAPPPAAGELRNFGTAAKPRCPVDGVEIQLNADTPRVNFRGNTYYFCGTLDPLGRTHKMLFLMDPLLYLTGQSGYPKPAPEALTASSAAAVTAAPSPQSMSAAFNLLNPAAVPSPPGQPAAAKPLSQAAAVKPTATPTALPTPTLTPTPAFTSF